MQLRLDKKFQKNVSGRFEKYRFEVGVLQDSPHKDPAEMLDGKQQLGSYAGGPVRKMSRKPGALSVSEVSAANRDRLGFNYLSEPFKKASSDIVRFSREFFRLAFGRSEKKRAENLIQAIVRNPILRGDYGSNTTKTQRIKGFDRKMIDTAQLFKSIKAICKVRGR